MHILISGASVAGPALAYWLDRYGFEVTVVERAPTLRKTGGHAVDLFRPAVQIVTNMGVLDAVQAKATGTEMAVIHRAGHTPLTLDLRKVYTAVSEEHVEIMRDDLSEIFYDATRGHVEYVFSDSITSISADGDVTFERGQPRRFDVIVGADGLHSNVRTLTFGPEAGLSTWIGAYLSVISVTNYLNLSGVMETVGEVGRVVGVYSAAHMADARAVFLFRTPAPLEYHYRDVARQKQLLREHFAGVDWEVPRLLAELDDTPAFYFDSITQLKLDTWSRGRVTLVGDAGYCPGPAVGGSTSLAVVGAYILAGELAASAPDHSAGFAAYEGEIGEYVKRSRTFAVSAAKKIVPARPLDLWMLVGAARLVNVLPGSACRAIAKLSTRTLRLHDSISVKNYQPPE
ncbi:MAG: FAD-dependent monooxygenase [Mycobacteriaceae bacterium]|nr:FAD-dependent monooxygenase [Mycobacteriaceae bacterium]